MPLSAPSPRRLSIQRKIVLGFGLVLAMLGLVALVGYRSTRAFIATAERVARTHVAMELDETMLRHLMEMESGHRDFLITGNEESLRGSDAARAKVLRDFEALKAAADTPEQSMRIEQLRPLLQRCFSLQQEATDARSGKRFEPVEAVWRDAKLEPAMAEVRALIEEFDRHQHALLSERAGLTRHIGRATKVAILAGSVLTFAALLAACVLILRDVGARLRAESQLAAEHNLLRSILDTIPDRVFVKDLTGRVILDNLAHRQTPERESGEAAGQPALPARELPAAKLDADENSVIATGEPILNREEPVLREDAAEVWTETTKVPLRDPAGEIIGLVGITADITARKAGEEKVRRAAAQLERSNSELQSFASVASHDLQEPLRKIQAFGDRLKVKCGEALSAQGRDYLDRMQNAAGRMQVLIQDLLKLSRVTSRALPFEPCDLDEIVRAVLSDLEVAIEQKNARIELGALPAIDADALQMRQLFQNLLSNALKFQRAGDIPLVSISAKVLAVQERVIPGAAPGESVCEIMVQDNGIGFNSKFGEQIFVVFQRLHSRSEFEGTGIGLAVCRKITDRHGGTIVAKSAEGQGATFIVTLPTKQTAEQADD